jgi:hypothetical protein
MEDQVTQVAFISDNNMRTVAAFILSVVVMDSAVAGVVLPGFSMRNYMIAGMKKIMKCFNAARAGYVKGQQKKRKHDAEAVPCLFSDRCQ